MAEMQVGEIKVKVVPDFEDFYANVEQFLRGKLELPVGDPLSRAIRDAGTDTFVGVKVGEETYRLNSWVIVTVDGTQRLITYWDSEKDLEKKWRIPWRKRIRLVLDRLWWRATGWI